MRPLRNVLPGDVYLLKEPKLRGSPKNHYCVVLRVQKDGAVINFLSSEPDLFDEQKDLLLRQTDPEFSTTGLPPRDCFYINQDYAIQLVPIQNLFALKPSRVGYISGEFKKRIEDLFGDKL